MAPEELISTTPLGRLLNRLAIEFPHSNLQSELDRFQKLDGKLDDSVYKSKIYHLARRLVILCEYAIRQSEETNESAIIERTFDQVFDMDLLADPALLKSLVYECHQNAKRKLSNSAKRKVRNSAKKLNGKCYICGTELSFDDKKHPTFCEVEHVLPRSLGGSNLNHNLKPACKECNGHKRSRIAGADLHFESMVYYYTEKGTDKISRFHDFASMLFVGYQCSLCGKSSETQGEMEQRLTNESDSWHLFNVEHVCDECQINRT